MRPSLGNIGDPDWEAGGVSGGAVERREEKTVEESKVQLAP